MWCVLSWCVLCADTSAFPFHSSWNSPIWGQWGRRQQIWTGHNVGCKFAGEQFPSQNFFLSFLFALSEFPWWQQLLLWDVHGLCAMCSVSPGHWPLFFHCHRSLCWMEIRREFSLAGIASVLKQMLMLKRRQGAGEEEEGWLRWKMGLCGADLQFLLSHHYPWIHVLTNTISHYFVLCIPFLMIWRAVNILFLALTALCGYLIMITSEEGLSRCRKVVLDSLIADRATIHFLWTVDWWKKSYIYWRVS